MLPCAGCPSPYYNKRDLDEVVHVDLCNADPILLNQLGAEVFAKSLAKNKFRIIMQVTTMALTNWPLQMDTVHPPQYRGSVRRIHV